MSDERSKVKEGIVFVYPGQCDMCRSRLCKLQTKCGLYVCQLLLTFITAKSLLLAIEETRRRVLEWAVTNVPNADEKQSKRSALDCPLFTSVPSVKTARFESGR